MSKLIRSFAILLPLILLASSAGAQQRRFNGKVTDQTGKPLAGVKISATSPDTTAFKAHVETNFKGEFVMMVLAESVTALRLRLEKEGYVTGESDVELSGSRMTRDYQMVSVDAQKAADKAKRGPDAAETHNAGTEAAKAGDWKTAAEKFRAALAIKEDIYQTHSALATAEFNLQEYANAEKSARRALELHPEQPELMTLLADTLDKLGNKTEAATWRGKVAEGDPKLRAVLAFNRGAELANAGKDPEAMVSFEEALAADPTLAEAHFNLGITAFRTGDMVKSRQHLETFVAAAPESKNIQTAKDILKAIPAPKPAAASR